MNNREDPILGSFKKAQKSEVKRDIVLDPEKNGWSRGDADKAAMKGDAICLAYVGAMIYKRGDKQRAYEYFDAAIDRLKSGIEWERKSAGMLAYEIAEFISDKDQKLTYLIRAMKHRNAKAYENYESNIGLLGPDNQQYVKLELLFAHWSELGQRNSFMDFHYLIQTCLNSNDAQSHEQLARFLAKRSESEVKAILNGQNKEFGRIIWKEVSNIHEKLEQEILSNALKGDMEFPLTPEKIERNIQREIEKIKKEKNYHEEHITKLKSDVGILVSKQLKEINDTVKVVNFDLMREIEQSQESLVKEMKTLLDTNGIPFNSDSFIFDSIKAVESPQTSTGTTNAFNSFIHSNNEAKCIALQLKALKDVMAEFTAPSAPSLDEIEPGAPVQDEKKPDQLAEFNKLYSVTKKIEAVNGELSEKIEKINQEIAKANQESEKSIEKADQAFSESLKTIEPDKWNKFLKIAVAACTLVGIRLMIQSQRKYGVHQFWSKDALEAGEARSSAVANIEMKRDSTIATLIKQRTTLGLLKEASEKSIDIRRKSLPPLPVAPKGHRR